MNPSCEITNDISNTSNGISASGRDADDEHWFSEGCDIYEHKPGTIIFTLTGLGDERICQRYASGEVRPSAYFFRGLLRTSHGWEWLNIAMRGSKEPWWLEVQDAIRIKRLIGNR